MRTPTYLTLFFLIFVSFLSSFLSASSFFSSHSYREGSRRDRLLSEGYLLKIESLLKQRASYGLPKEKADLSFLKNQGLKDFFHSDVSSVVKMASYVYAKRFIRKERKKGIIFHNISNETLLLVCCTLASKMYEVRSENPLSKPFLMYSGHTIKPVEPVLTNFLSWDFVISEEESERVYHSFCYRADIRILRLRKKFIKDFSKSISSLEDFIRNLTAIKKI